MSLIKRIACGWRLNPETIERVKKAATKLRRSQVDQVEIILEEWLEKFESDNK